MSGRNGGLCRGGSPRAKSADIGGVVSPLERRGLPAREERGPALPTTPDHCSGAPRARRARAFASPPSTQAAGGSPRAKSADRGPDPPGGGARGLPAREERGHQHVGESARPGGAPRARRARPFNLPDTKVYHGGSPRAKSAVQYLASARQGQWGLPAREEQRKSRAMVWRASTGAPRARRAAVNTCICSSWITRGLPAREERGGKRHAPRTTSRGAPRARRARMSCKVLPAPHPGAPRARRARLVTVWPRTASPGGSPRAKSAGKGRHSFSGALGGLPAREERGRRS